MGKFNGMLLVSDFDNTLLYTEKALTSNGEYPPMSVRNTDGIRYWIREGGTFAVATGRAMSAYRPYTALVPTNAPTVVDNGGAIYDYGRGEYLVSLALPETAMTHIRAIMGRFPDTALELYQKSGTLQVMNPTDWNRQHAKLTGLNYTVITNLEPETVSLPLSKALFVANHDTLLQVRDFALGEDWGTHYELIFSSDHLLEMTVKGANKGAMVTRLKEMTGCRTLICAGDHLNDLPMLRAADRAFCPANAEPDVLSSGAEVVCHCLEGAVGEIIERLDKELI